MPAEIYLIDHTLERYRWVGPIEDSDDWARRLTKVRHDPVADGWEPVPVEWLPETSGRAIPDFPNFWGGMLCASRRAVAVLGSYLQQGGEFLQLRGLEGEYIAWHCRRTIDVLNQPATEEAVKEMKGRVFSSPTFVPRLLLDEIPDDYDVFRVPQSFQKVFVRRRFLDAYRHAGLTGLEFLPVPLRRQADIRVALGRDVDERREMRGSCGDAKVGSRPEADGRTAGDLRLRIT